MRSVLNGFMLAGGAEFTHRHQLSRALGIATCIRDPHGPWQKGGIENAIGRLRPALPRKTILTPARLQMYTERYNHSPRECLSFLTPQKVF